MAKFTRADGTRYNVAKAEERGDRCFIGKKGYYFYDYTPDWAIDEKTVTGPFSTFATAQNAGYTSQRPALIPEPKPNPSQVVYLMTQTELNAIHAQCQAGTQAHGDEFYEPIMQVIDGLTRMDA